MQCKLICRGVVKVEICEQLCNVGNYKCFDVGALLLLLLLGCLLSCPSMLSWAVACQFKMNSSAGSLLGVIVKLIPHSQIVLN